MITPLVERIHCHFGDYDFVAVEFPGLGIHATTEHPFFNGETWISSATFRSWPSS